jgi:ABC-2 type transport system ATP-binding protein
LEQGSRDSIEMRPTETVHSKSEPPPRRELVVRMQGVSRYFDKPGFVRALTNVSFEVRRGEVFGLLGPSGSGKSTALRVLAGRLPPSEGKARVFGRPPRRHSARMRVGYLPQRASHNKSHLLAQVAGFLRDVFMWRPGNPAPKPDDLIPANERSLILKQVLARNPELLLLDEPFAALDAAGCAEMKDLIMALAQRGKTVILASDSLTCAKDVCDRLAVCYAGRIERLGTLDEVLATTDAIRVVGPVLPPETAQRVLQTLREGLGRPGSAAEPPAPRPQGGSPIAVPAPVTEPATVAATADEVLAPLVGSPGAASNAVREQTVSSVNNDRLAALTKPAPTAAPHGPDNTNHLP